MDDSQTVSGTESEQTAPPTPPRPRGKHRLPPRRATQAAPTEPGRPPADSAPTPDVTAPDAAPADAAVTEVAPPSEPAESVPAELESAEPEPAEPESAEPEPAGTPPRTRRMKWFRRRPRQAPPAVDDDPATEAPAEPPGEAATEPATAGQPAEPKPATKRLVIAVAAAAGLFVAAAAFAGAMLQPYLADRALVNTKLDIARTAANAITTLWTYTPEDMDKLPDRSAKYLGGDFQAAYRKYVDGIAPANKQAQISNSTQVMGAAVETLDGPNATAVVYTNTIYSTPVTKNVPSLQYLSYRLTMQRKDSRWLITHMTTITSTNLTPKLG
jgi:Mce-associated membrane protein